MLISTLLVAEVHLSPVKEAIDPILDARTAICPYPTLCQEQSAPNTPCHQGEHDISGCMHAIRNDTHLSQKEKEEGKDVTTPFGVNLMRTQI